jgi:hypothetical protein
MNLHGLAHIGSLKNKIRPKASKPSGSGSACRLRFSFFANDLGFALRKKRGTSRDGQILDMAALRG